MPGRSKVTSLSESQRDHDVSESQRDYLSDSHPECVDLSRSRRRKLSFIYQQQTYLSSSRHDGTSRRERFTDPHRDQSDAYVVSRRVKMIRNLVLGALACGAMFSFLWFFETVGFQDSTLEGNRGLSRDNTHELPQRSSKNSTSRFESSSNNSIHQMDDKERSIHLVHIGKTGGITLREATGIQCQNFKDSEACINRLFSQDQKLARQTQHVFHMWGYNEELIRNATSFLVTLRNPVERIISTYRFSHPENCRNHRGFHEPYGCHLLKTWRKTGKPKMTPYASKLYRICFPSPAMEDFAQSILTSPWVSNPNFERNLTATQQQECRSMARTLVQGGENRGAAPHMEMNYEYYISKTIRQYPEKEVFVVRTEKEWDDMIALDRQLGGSGKFANHGRSVSHGSEYFHSSPVSDVAYQKLCCVLEHEIEVYLDVLNRSVNLDEGAKQESEETLRMKCKVASSWEEWRQDCQQRLQQDQQYLADTQ